MIVVFAYSVTPDKAAYDEPVHLYLHCSHCLSILSNDTAWTEDFVYVNFVVFFFFLTF